MTSTISETTASWWRKNRRRNSCHCERATGSTPGWSSSSRLDGDVRDELVSAMPDRVAADAAPVAVPVLVDREDASRQPDPRVEHAVQHVGEQVEER